MRIPGANVTLSEDAAPMSKKDFEDCKIVIERMQAVSAQFYLSATHTGCHAFIEFCGLMNEYIKICQASLEKGIDFRMANTHNEIALVMQTHHAKYLAEKLDCIYGPSLRANPKLMEAFQGHV